MPTTILKPSVSGLNHLNEWLQALVHKHLEGKPYNHPGPEFHPTETAILLLFRARLMKFLHNCPPMLFQGLIVLSVNELAKDTEELRVIINETDETLLIQFFEFREQFDLDEEIKKAFLKKWGVKIGHILYDTKLPQPLAVEISKLPQLQ